MYIFIFLVGLVSKLENFQKSHNSDISDLTKEYRQKSLMGSPSAATTYQTISPGAIIVDMGIVPQTEANGLKPYGMIFDLIKNYDVQILWIIDPNKVTNKNTGIEGTDLVYNGQSFKGGPFIIQSEFISTAVQIAIDSWVAKGVQVVTTNQELTVPVEVTLTTVPNWTLDFANGHRLFSGFIAAEIPEFNDPGGTDANYVFKSPDELDCCDYMYAMPHADPVWSTHNNLNNWVMPKSQGGCRGWIYGACHAISALENIFDDQTPDVTVQTNFLCNKTGNANLANSPWADNSLILWTGHGDGDGTYDYNNSSYTDPFMQFMGITDGALENGSEQIFMPHNGTSWRNSTTVSIYDANQSDVGVISPGPAAKMAYGPAYGNGDYADYSAGNGWVMYLGGHEISGTEEQFVAAYRAFFNFSFMSAFDRGATISYTFSTPPSMQEQSTISLSASATGSLGPYTFEWSANPDVGYFTNNPQTASSGQTVTVTYTAPATNSPLDVIITLSVRDQCNIVAKESSVVTILPPEQPPLCEDLIVYLAPNQESVIDLTTITSDVNENLFPSGIVITGNPGNGSVVRDVNAVATYTPVFNFIGTDSYIYTATDQASNSCSGTITLIVECPSDVENNQIFGTVFNDVNQNGILDAGDTGFNGGATITLFRDDSPTDGIPDGPAEQTTTTNLLGGYNFVVSDSYSQTVSARFYLGSSLDDAREKNSGRVENNRNEHNFTDNGDNEWNGFIFRNVTIPSGAIISSANITFTAHKTNSGNNANMRFYGEDNTSNPTAFNSCGSCYGITSRPVTANYLDWNGLPVFIENSTYQSPDIKNIVQEIVTDRAGLSNGGIAIITQAIGPSYDQRKVRAYDNIPVDAPYLDVVYTIIPAGQSFNYIVDFDDSALPPNYVLTTPTEITVEFNALGTADCQNNFGYFVPSGCGIIYTNPFLGYNRK